MLKFTADFETTTNIDDCRVWAWALCEIGNTDNFIYGNSIETFFNYIFNFNNLTLYFHNLKFDGQFILSWLFENEFKFNPKFKELGNKEFTTLISDMGLFYSIKIKINNNTINIYDSLKILNFKVSDIAKAFNTPDNKLSINYEENREVGHQLTKEEIDYIHNDVSIVATALNILFNEGLTKITVGSDALHDYKSLLGEKLFRNFFPVIDYDKHIRQAYKGGFTYLNPTYKNKIVNNITILDVNSLYPSVMYNEYLPYGEGIYFEGEYKEDKVYNLYIQCFTCNFDIKEDKIPTIQLKNSKFFAQNEYVESSEGQDITLVLTNVDFKLFKDNYNIYNIEYHWGWKFKSSNQLFKKYIDKWVKIKNESTLNHNKPMRTLAKLMLNSLYGKFALSPEVRSKYPTFENGIVGYEFGPKEEREPIYIPVGCFITSYARYKTISSSQIIKDYSISKYGEDMYIYSDTDSIHTSLPQCDIKKILKISPINLGEWKIEGFAKKGKFIRQKTYIEKLFSSKKDIKSFKLNNSQLKHHVGKNTIMNITCAGMPNNCYKYVKWDNFCEGLTVKGKLSPKKVKGGVVLLPIDFTIK